MKKHKGIELNGIRYFDSSKCISCSSEVDKGGRLELKKRTRYFLKCNLCKYTILSTETRNRQENREASMRKRILRGY
jgi:DNA-directed RNA polymerase subunit RPC12/RpoP